MRAAGQPLIAVLAAGRGARFGGGKLLADLGGRPLGRHALDTALATGLPVVWIASAGTAALAPPPCRVLVNPAPERGLGGSLAMGAAAARHAGAPALLVLLADMPLVSPDLIARLAAHAATGEAAACRHPDGRAGVPALIPPALFPALEALDGDAGAGRLLRNLPGLALITPGLHDLLDVDTPADLAHAARLIDGSSAAER